MLHSTGGVVNPRAGRAAQKVVVVNGSQEILDLLETVLGAGHYDVVFVAETAHAYSQIRHTRPQLVLLCVAIDDPLGFQVLSMLKLDPETADIPVLTYTNEFEGNRAEAVVEDEYIGDEMPVVRPELPPN